MASQNQGAPPRKRKVKLERKHYTVGWFCALFETEFEAAKTMLDDLHEQPHGIALPHEDKNTYAYGSINGHRVVIASMPPSQPEPVSITTLIKPLEENFPKMKIRLSVGVASGIPRIPPARDPKDDIYLGDVVVKWRKERGTSSATHNKPAPGNGEGDSDLTAVLEAIEILKIKHEPGVDIFKKHLRKLSQNPGFQAPGIEYDRAEHSHINDGDGCARCDRNNLVKELARPNRELVFHLGSIISGKSIVQDAKKRDRLAQLVIEDLKNKGALTQIDDGVRPLCIDVEAREVMGDRRWIVIRGISDYADSHRNDSWRGYAAATAAAFARELLCSLSPPSKDIDKGPATNQKKLPDTHMGTNGAKSINQGKQKAVNRVRSQTDGKPNFSNGISADAQNPANVRKETAEGSRQQGSETAERAQGQKSVENAAVRDPKTGNGTETAALENPPKGRKDGGSSRVKEETPLGSDSSARNNATDDSQGPQSTISSPSDSEIVLNTSGSEVVSITTRSHTENNPSIEQRRTRGMGRPAQVASGLDANDSSQAPQNTIGNPPDSGTAPDPTGSQIGDNPPDDQRRRTHRERRPNQDALSLNTNDASPRRTDHRREPQEPPPNNPVPVPKPKPKKNWCCCL